jgi:hypothetical protein
MAYTIDDVGSPSNGMPLTTEQKQELVNEWNARAGAKAARVAYESANAHRRQREVAYITILSKEQPHATSFQRTVGDMLDAIFKQVEANRIAAGASRVPEFDDAITKIAEVKAQFPAPRI